MAPIKWDAYRTLNITSRDSGGMTCVGTTRFGKRCRWDIPDKEFSQICSILDEFETKAPANATSSLERLAQLSLCEKYHQHQAFEKIDEWEVAIEEATQFYESGRGLKEKNRELKELLRVEKSKRDELERKFDEEISRRKQELKSIGSMSMEVSSLRAKLKQSETEARDSKEVAQKMSKSYDKSVADMEERISILRAEWNDERQNMMKTMQKEAKEARSMRSELKKSKASEIDLVNQVSELTSQLETQAHAYGTLQSELIQVTNERELALSQRDEFKSQLETAVEKIDRIGSSLQEAEVARDMLSEEEERFHERLSIGGQNLKSISDAKARLEEKYAGLVQDVGTLNARIDELIQEMAYAKLHPFRTFFVNLFEVTMGWVKSAFACFGRLRTRKTLDPQTMEESMPSP